MDQPIPTRRPPAQLVTVKQYAAEYQVTPRTVYRWVETQAVETRRHGPRGSIRIVRSAADDAGGRE